MKTNKFELIKLKRLALFFFACISLVFSGSLISNTISLDKVFVLFAVALCGIVLIYDMQNIDTTASLFNKTKQFFKHKRQVFFFLLLIILIPIAKITLTQLSFFLFASSGILGGIYSITFKRNNIIYRLKNVFILKNILIGIAWGALVLIGAGNIENNLVILTSLLAFIQVFIGSVIRDIPDKEKDIDYGIQSIPAVIGESKTILIMHFINLSCLAILLIPQFDLNFSILVLSITSWRFLNLFKIKTDLDSNFWGQTINLLTCCLFFIISLIQFLWD